MASVFLHTSNRLEALAAELARRVATPAASGVLRPDVVVVPSLAMRRWLTFEIARVNGVCANIRFPFLSEFISSLPAEFLAKSRSGRRMDPDVMIWRIHARLPALVEREEFAPVRHYLAGADPLKLYQLSARLAALFDQYVVYRPDMITRWEEAAHNASGDEAWQALLWRDVQRDDDEAPAETPVEIPERLLVFYVAEMPPIYLEHLFQVAASRPVHLFLLRPSREYVGGEPTPKQRARLNLAPPDPDAANPLLVSLGRSSSHFTELLLETDERLGPLVQEASECFPEPAADTLLSKLQSDILTATKGGRDVTEIAEDDDSIVIHSCHSPMREVEVLYDQLLALFQRDPTLRPRDVLVMAPEIEKYSPLIHAVFAYPEKPERKIPYSISDRHPRSASTAIDAFLKLLELATSRCTAPAVYGLICSEIVAQRFRFSEADLALIHTWIKDTGICWGMDAAHRQRLGLPAVHTNTWRFGLDRLLLGYALRGRNRILFEEILPYDEVEGDRTDLLGRFVSAIEAVFEFVTALQTPRPLLEWASVLRHGIDDLLQSDDEEQVHDLRFLRKTVSRFETVAPGPGQTIDVSVVRHHLEQTLQVMEQRGGFLTGGVTFCALKPGRSIPARVICLLGLNDNVFPRRPERAQFDLMADWRRGDPSPREDDRQAFLETICAAGEHLQISYLGRSMADNEAIPPSVVLSELCDYLQQAFRFPGEAKARDYLTIEHPLQAFSPRYFTAAADDQRLFSHSEANAAAAVAIVSGNKTTARPFLTGPPPVVEGDGTIQLTDLVKFLGSPPRAFLKMRFGVDLRDFESTLPEDEPLQLDALEQFKIRQELLTEWLDRGEADLQIFSARALTAPGAFGSLQLRGFRRDVADFRSEVLRHLGGWKKGAPIELNLRLGELSLAGTIESLYGGRIVHSRCGALRVVDRLAAWVEHLARCAQEPKAQQETVAIGRDRGVLFRPVENAAELLADLCRLYVEGVQAPLPFFPKSGYAYVEAERESRNTRKLTLDQWSPFRRADGEKDDTAIKLLFQAPDPLAEETLTLARRVFGPLLAHQEETEAA